MVFRARHHQFSFPRPVLVMGILNVTPDSFSDGGEYLDRDKAVARALEMARQGAEIIDIGGESSRPYAPRVSEVEELARVLPVITELARRLDMPLSIDTQKTAVARAAVEAGASIINHISGHPLQPELCQILRETGAGYVAMHMQGTPQTMQICPAYQNVVEEVFSFFQDRLSYLTEQGVASEQTVLDTGIGFGKARKHNLALIAQLPRFVDLGRPMLLGVSRKSFLSPGAGSPISARLPGALACTCWAVRSGVNIIRTHDVEATVAVIRMTEELLAHQTM